MKKGLKIIMVILATTLISLGLHALIPTTVPLTEDVLTPVVIKLSFVGTVILYFLVTYSIITAVFLRYQGRLWGSKFMRALLFGSLVGGGWWIGMIESVFALGTDLLGEFLTGLLDFVPIVLLCLFLGAFIVEEGKREGGPGKAGLQGAFTSICIFLVVMVVGRSLRHLVTGVGYDGGLTVPVIIWMALFALVISLNFQYMKSAIINASFWKPAAHFTLVLFGLHYLMFVYFMPLIFKGTFMEFTVVLLYDLILVFLASLLSLRFDHGKPVSRPGPGTKFFPSPPV